MPTPLRCNPKLLEKDLTNQVIIVTGANSGCGLETARQLGQQGATVILACRSVERGEAAAKKVQGGVFMALDLASLESVRNFVKSFEEKSYNRLDALINNAGIMACPFAKTKDNFEMQIGCNHLGHFLLTHLLTPLLLKTADTKGEPSRVVILSSCSATAMNIGSQKTMAYIDFDDLNWETRPYDENMAYQQSKLANYLHALEASRRYPADKLIVTSVHPGWVQSNLDIYMFNSMFGTHLVGRTMANSFRKFMLWKGNMITAVDGAQTTLYCVLEDAKAMKSGAFYSQFGAYQDKPSQKGGWPMTLPNPNATPEAATKLWEASEQLVGIQ
jgi:NAD(P)-dependent dehydrogenase (short-subunit alcohol dehydrogenase family)